MGISSNILLEALSCNKRIVCFDIKGGTREILLMEKMDLSLNMMIIKTWQKKF